MSELPVISFASAAEWEAWLAEHHTQAPGLWLRFYKKASGRATITYREAVDGALCYGWIDGQVKTYDAESWIQRFTPRRPKSGWSKINTTRAKQLIKEKRMAPAGLAAVAAAKRDGRWQAAYDSPSSATIPPEFLRELKRHSDAETFFKTLNKANLYAIAYRLQTARKPETRRRRVESIIAKLAKGEKFHG